MSTSNANIFWSQFSPFNFSLVIFYLKKINISVVGSIPFCFLWLSEIQENIPSPAWCISIFYSLLWKIKWCVSEKLVAGAGWEIRWAGFPSHVMGASVGRFFCGAMNILRIFWETFWVARFHKMSEKLITRHAHQLMMKDSLTKYLLITYSAMQSPGGNSDMEFTLWDFAVGREVLCWRPPLCPPAPGPLSNLLHLLCPPPPHCGGVADRFGLQPDPLPSVALLGSASGRHWQKRAPERKAGVFIPLPTPSQPGCPLVVSGLLFSSLQLLTGDPLLSPETVSPACPSW